MASSGGPIPLDLTLLSGFSYDCRPDCGLCCYAAPSVGPREREPLLQILPAASLGSGASGEFIRSNPDGGACSLLETHRCRGHAVRPSICRQFPLLAHVGDRLQATVVLTCPGVDLGVLAEYSAAAPSAPPRGFEGELAALRGRIDPGTRRSVAEGARRRRKIQRRFESEGRWEDEASVRAALRSALPRPAAEDFPVEAPPAYEDGPELLPLVFDGRTGPVAIGAALGGWELMELAPTGGVARSLGVVPPPERVPELSDAGDRVLAGYLRYWLERDSLFGTVHLEMKEASDGTVRDWVRDELRGIAALTVSRAQVLASLHRGAPGPLTRSDVELGIRAADQDLLDRATWGTRL